MKPQMQSQTLLIVQRRPKLLKLLMQRVMIVLRIVEIAKISQINFNFHQNKTRLTSDLCELVNEASDSSSSSGCIFGATFFNALLNALSTASV